MISLSPPPIGADALAAAKAFLRIEQDSEDALIQSLLGAAILHAEAFTNVAILRRSGAERLAVSPAWQRLGATPVHAITSAVGIQPDGSRLELSLTAYALDIDGSGDGWLRVTAPEGSTKVEVAVETGLAADWTAIPESLRLAVLRLFGHLYSYRDDPADAGPPAAVAALLRPWRRMRLA